MRFKTIFTVLLLVSLFAVSGVAQTYNYEEMTQEQYNAYLAEWQQRQEAGQTGIDQENAAIDELNKELDALQADIDGTWDGLYAAGTSDKAGYDSYGSSLDQLKGEASSMLSQSPEELYSKMNEVEELQAKLDAVKNEPFSATGENAQEINNIQNIINQAREKGKAAIPPPYTVVRGDYLWKIAAKEDIYNNPFAWIRIFSTNSDQIKNPDLIYTDQVFSIPRVTGPNEHLVEKGESLFSIAGRHGSPFTWQKIYEANKSMLSDPNVIYPFQVLKLQ